MKTAGIIGLAIGLAVGWAAASRPRRRFGVESTDALAMASHELRGPLTIVTGYLDVLERRWSELGDDERRDLVERARHAARRENHLVETLLDRARLEAGQTSVTPRPLDLRAEADRIIHDYELDRDQEITIDVRDGVVVAADPEALDRILGNLLSNAVRHAPDGTIVKVRAEEDDGDVVVSVTNAGSVIPPEEQHEIFEPFHRAPGAPSGGNGLGLTIARHYVELLGGRIWAESPEAGGAVFSFTLRHTTGSAATRTFDASLA